MSRLPRSQVPGPAVDVAAATPHGFVMAADRRFSYAGPPPVVDDTGRKVLPWPKMRAAVGFAGVAVQRRRHDGVLA